MGFASPLSAAGFLNELAFFSCFEPVPLCMCVFVLDFINCLLSRLKMPSLLVRVNWLFFMCLSRSLAVAPQYVFEAHGRVWPAAICDARAGPQDLAVVPHNFQCHTIM